ncbi:alpha/beta fold hydrolase [Actinomadura keratinilytica]
MHRNVITPPESRGVAGCSMRVIRRAPSVKRPQNHMNRSAESPAGSAPTASPWHRTSRGSSPARRVRAPPGGRAPRGARPPCTTTAPPDHADCRTNRPLGASGSGTMRRGPQGAVPGCGAWRPSEQTCPGGVRCRRLGCRARSDGALGGRTASPGRARTNPVERLRDQGVPHAPVRHREGSARPCQAGRAADHAGAQPGAAHREVLAGAVAGQSGRAGRQWAEPGRTCGVGVAERGGGPVRRDRVRPAGVGRSEPALDCRPGHFAAVRPDTLPLTPAVERANRERATAFAAACGERHGDLLPYLDTRSAARDLDVIRAALGAPRISYLGYSYGTYLGAVYAKLFPERVRRLALDSAVDPDGVWYDSNLAQDYAFEDRHRAFLAWVAKNDAVYGLGGDPAAVEGAWSRMRAAVAAEPAGGKVGAAELEDTFLPGGYYDGYWPRLATAFAAYAKDGESGPLVTAYRALAESDAAATTGTACTRRCSAGTRPGPASGASGGPTPGGCTRRRPSWPGTTPGTTRRARAGRSRRSPRRT